MQTKQMLLDRIQELQNEVAFLRQLVINLQPQLPINILPKPYVAPYIGPFVPNTTPGVQPWGTTTCNGQRPLDGVKVEYHTAQVPATLPLNSGSTLRASVN